MLTQQKKQDVYNADATEKSCASYKQRNTGDNYGDKCADCDVVRRTHLFQKDSMR